MEFIIVFITASSEDAGVAIAKALVEERLAGCVNVIRGVRSIYRWQGTIEDEGEVLMVLKTRRSLFEGLRARVKELHEYTVPEIIALPVVEGSPEYLAWLADETGEKAG